MSEPEKLSIVQRTPPWNAAYRPMQLDVLSLLSDPDLAKAYSWMCHLRESEKLYLDEQNFTWIIPISKYGKPDQVRFESFLGMPVAYAEVGKIMVAVHE